MGETSAEQILIHPIQPAIRRQLRQIPLPSLGQVPFQLCPTERDGLRTTNEQSGGEIKRLSTELEKARASFAGISAEPTGGQDKLSVRVFGSAGGPLKALFSTRNDSEQVESSAPLAPATVRRRPTTVCASMRAVLCGVVRVVDQRARVRAGHGAQR